MKKTIMFLGVLSLGLAHAQQNDPYAGKVGINTPEPNATLDIKAHKTDGSQKEGLLIPRMSKTAISKIAQPETSTLIYVNDVNYTAGEASANTRVEKVDAVGFYHYNGTQWVKHLDTDTNDAEWVYDPATKRINLKRSGQDTKFTNNVFYNSNTGQFVNADKTLLVNHNNIAQGNGVANILLRKSSNILTDNGGKKLSSSILNIDEPSAVQGNFNAIASEVGVRLTEANKTPSSWFAGSSSFIDKNDDNKTDYLSGASNSVILNKGTVAGYATANRSETYINTSGNVNETRGISSFLTAAENSTNINEMVGISSFVRLGSANLTINRKVVGFSTLMDYTDFNPNVQNLIGFHYQGVQYKTNMGNNTVNHYGILVEDVDRAQNNYAIYTKAGQVRVGDLKGTGNRNVYADADGVLKVGEASNAKLGNANACNAQNAGTIRYDEVSNGSGVFGFCVKRRTDAGTDEYVWAYIKGGSNIFGTSANGANFGDGL